MKTVSKLVAAALLVTAAAPAFADHRDCDREDGRAVAYPVYPAPGPGPWQDVRHGDRDGQRRAQERARLRVEFARLDEQRNDFYARWGRNPRKVARFERWYAAERAELQRQWNALDWRFAAR